MREIKVGTVFSGIGSPEQDLKRLNVPHKVMFACDNGECMISCDYKAEFAIIKSLSSAKDKREYVDQLYAKCTRQTNKPKTREIVLLLSSLYGRTGGYGSIKFPPSQCF